MKPRWSIRTRYITYLEGRMPFSLYVLVWRRIGITFAEAKLQTERSNKRSPWFLSLIQSYLSWLLVLFQLLLTVYLKSWYHSSLFLDKNGFSFDLSSHFWEFIGHPTCFKMQLDLHKQKNYWRRPHFKARWSIWINLLTYFEVPLPFSCLERFEGNTTWILAAKVAKRAVN